MKTCPDCGSRVYNLGCVNCNEDDYIEEQIQIDSRKGYDTRPIPPAPRFLPDGTDLDADVTF